MWTLTHDIFFEKFSRWFEDFIDSEYLFIVMDILRLLLFIIVSQLDTWVEIVMETVFGKT